MTHIDEKIKIRISKLADLVEFQERFRSELKEENLACETLITITPKRMYVVLERRKTPTFMKMGVLSYENAKDFQKQLNEIITIWEANRNKSDEKTE